MDPEPAAPRLEPARRRDVEGDSPRDLGDVSHARCYVAMRRPCRSCAWARRRASRSRACVWLASSAGTYVTGETVVVDGGQWLWKPPIAPREMVLQMSRGVESKSRGVGTAAPKSNSKFRDYRHMCGLRCESHKIDTYI